MEIKLDPLSFGKEKSRLERALEQLPKPIFSSNGTIEASAGYLSDSLLRIVLKVFCKDFFKQVIPPKDAEILTADPDSIKFHYKGETYLFLYQGL